MSSGPGPPAEDGPPLPGAVTEFNHPLEDCPTLVVEGGRGLRLEERQDETEKIIQDGLGEHQRDEPVPSLYRAFSSADSRMPPGPSLSRAFSWTKEKTIELQRVKSQSPLQLFGQRFVLKETSVLRRTWDIVVALMLLYTASIFIYRIVFIQFRMSAYPADANDSGDDCAHNLEAPGVCEAFQIFDQVLFYMFVIDFFANFFFSYPDTDGVEVTNLGLCALNYLQGHCILNLLACMPTSVVETIISSIDTGGQTGGVQSTVHLVKLPRITRLVRLARITGLLKMVKIKERMPILKRIMQKRAVRIASQLVSLAFMVHLVACGWYLCAALHENHALTWVGRRVSEGPDGKEESLLLQGHSVQWAHSVYFVLTVFTTVGFGDMSAVTTGEIIYVCFTMLIGAVIHSIVISEVISVVQSQDAAKAFVESQTSLIDAFCEHTEVQPSHLAGVKDWISLNRHSWMKMHYDKAGMRQIITGKQMPRALLGKLPQQLFKGELMRNRLLVDASLVVPPRLPLLLALAMNRTHCKQNEVVYEMNDFPFSMFLVLSGTFAHVGVPGKEGGEDSSGNPVMLLGVKALVSSASPPPSPRRTATQQIKSFMNTGFGKQSYSPEGSGGASSPKAPPAPKLKGPRLYPYQLYGRGAYFGDLELMDVTVPRVSSARCESESGGELLMLPNVDLTQICEMFLKFGRLWRSWAIRRAVKRKAMLEKLTFGYNFRTLAATTVQNFWRDRKDFGGPSVTVPAGPHSRIDLESTGSECELKALSQKAMEPYSPMSIPNHDWAAQHSPPEARAARQSEVDEMKAGMQALQKQGAEMQANMSALRADFGSLREDLRRILAASTRG